MQSQTDPDVKKPDIRTPVTILTGFLGGGKTTLLNAAMRDPCMTRTAIVINEFGSVPIDNALSVASSDSIMVLENGCLCCTVFGDLVETLNRLYHDREAGKVPGFDRVVIETSGLADPTPVLQAFLSEPTLEGLYRVANVVAVMDAVNGPETLKRHSESVRQAAVADQLIVTKLDLVVEAERQDVLSALTKVLRDINPVAHVSIGQEISPAEILKSPGLNPADGGAATLAWLNNEAYGHKCDGENHDHHHHHDHDVTSFCLIRDEPSSRQALDLLFSAIEKNLGPQLLRVKGLVSVEGESAPAVIQGAQHLLHNLTWLDRWPSDDHRTRIVFITQHIPRETLAEMVELLDRVATRTANARLHARSAG